MMRKILLSCLLISVLSGCKEIWFDDKKKEKLPGERIRLNGMYSGVKIPVAKKVDVTIPIASVPNALVSSAGAYDGTYYNVAVKDDFKQARSLKFSKNHNLASITMPVITYDMIYMQETDGGITAYSNANGAKVWFDSTFKEKKKHSSTYQQGGMSIFDGVLFATSGSDLVIALNARSGEKVWVTQLPSMTRSVPVVHGNLAIIQTTSDDIYALDIKSGEIIWTYIGIKNDVQVLNTTSPVTRGNYVIFQNAGSEVIALDSSSGSEIWSVNLSSVFEKVNSSQYLSNNVRQLTLDGDYVFAVGSDGAVYSIDARHGKVNWKQPLNASHPITIGGDLLFTLNSGSQMVAISKHSGEVMWLESLPSSKDMEAWSQPAVINGKVVTVSTKGKWIGLNFNNGKIDQELKFINSVLLPPRVVGGSLYVFSSKGNLVEYK